MRLGLDIEDAVWLSALLFSFILLVSCGVQEVPAPIVDEPTDIVEEPVVEDVSSTMEVGGASQVPEAEQEAAVEETPEEELSPEEIIKQLGIETEPEPAKPTSCREANLPTTYEACINACERQCGGIEYANCQDVELSESVRCYGCRCE